jgi:hypothetical protein
VTRLRDRTTGDLLVMLIASTVCFLVVGTGVTIMVVEILNPQVDTEGAVGQVSDVVNTLIGLLAGFLAGRSDVAKIEQETRRRIEREQEQSGTA